MICLTTYANTVWRTLDIYNSHPRTLRLWLDARYGSQCQVPLTHSSSPQTNATQTLNSRRILGAGKSWEPRACSELHMRVASHKHGFQNGQAVLAFCLVIPSSCRYSWPRSVGTNQRVGPATTLFHPWWLFWRSVILQPTLWETLGGHVAEDKTGEDQRGNTHGFGT